MGCAGRGEGCVTESMGMWEVLDNGNCVTVRRREASVGVTQKARNGAAF